MKYLVTLTLLVGSIGCQDATPSQARLDAAMLINDDTARHNALVACAENAAKDGEDRVAIDAISRIEKKTARDTVRAKCCELLMKNGEAAAAAKIANQIERETARENALGKLAGGGDQD